MFVKTSVSQLVLLVSSGNSTQSQSCLVNFILSVNILKLFDFIILHYHLKHFSMLLESIGLTAATHF